MVICRTRVRGFSQVRHAQRRAVHCRVSRVGLLVPGLNRLCSPPRGGQFGPRPRGRSLGGGAGCQCFVGRRRFGKVAFRGWTG